MNTQAAPTLHPEAILRYFEYEHLSGPLKDISRTFKNVADLIVRELPRNPERTMALRKLLEAKDCAVRAALDIVPDPKGHA